ncbi:MAG: TonB-dependent receptor [Steroidobacteraceae bacterium]
MRPLVLRLARDTARALLLLAAGALAHAIETGEPLGAALDALARSGLNIVYSDALITPDMRVRAPPRPGPLAEVARELLAPHGLVLEPVQPGVYVVVRRSIDGEAAIDLVVEGADGRPARGAEVTLRPGDRRVVTDAGGRARFGPLPPGSYDAEAGDTAGGAARLRGIRVHRNEQWKGVLRLAGAGEPLAEVSVLASRYSFDRQSRLAPVEFTREDLSVLPGLDEDALRITRFLPGTATNGLSARAHVRGGRVDELGVYFDGVPLFEPFHFKDFQGLLGILDPATTGKLDFWSGVTPARYGGRLSGVLDITPRTFTGGNHHEVGVSLLYAHALSQGRLESHPLEWLVAARKSTIEQVMKLAEERSGEPAFLDLLSRLSWHFDDGSDIAAGWLLLNDELTANLSDDTERAHARYRDGTAWLRGTWRVAPDTALRGSVSRTERHTSRKGTLARPGSGAGELLDRRFMDATTARIELAAARGRTDVSVGVEMLDHDTSYEYRADALFDPLLAAALGRPPALSRNFAIDAGGQSYGVYASAVIALSPQLDVDLGMRWDRQRFRPDFSDSQWSPRLGLAFTPRADTTLRVSWGQLAQPERPDELQVTDGEAAYHAVQRATQAVGAIEHRLSNDVQLRVEAFDKRIHDVRPIHENLFDPVTLLPELEVDRVRVAPLSSRAYGAEFTLRWQPRRTWSAWLSYSWSEVTDRFEDSRALRTWDQRHSAVTGLSWTQGPWQLSGNFIWHSGWRENTLTALATPGGGAQLVLSPRNADAWSDYFSFDARASWQRALPLGALQVYVELSNATDHANTCCTEYRLAMPGDPASLEGERSTWLPRYALIGVTWSFP